jgi:DNA polymerase-3 subunit gamma/tau
MRDAISLLDQLLSYDEEVLDLARVERVLGLVDTSAVARLVDCMATNNSAGGLTLINGMVSDGMELGQLVDQIIAYLRGVLFLRITQSKESLDVSEDIRAIMVQQASGLEVRDLLGAIRVFLDARSELRDQVPGVPQLPVELAFLRALPQRREGEAPGPNPVSVAPQTAFQSTPAPVTQQPAQVATPALRSPQVTASAAKSALSAADNGEEALLERARAGWDPFLDLAGKRCGVKLQAALRSVRTLDLSGETLVLRFSHAFAQEMVNQPQYRSQLESVWEEVLGRPIRLRCALQSENVDPAPSHTTAAAMAEDNDLLLQEARNMGAVVKPLKTER